jgi:hypothetical protein
MKFSPQRLNREDSANITIDVLNLQMITDEDKMKNSNS